MPGHWWRRTAALLALAAGASLALATAAPAPAASPGTWGAGHYPYVDGTVCHSGPTTSPLAAWAVSGGHRAYLTRAVNSNGRFDSAAPPVPSAGTPAAPIDVGPGPEFASQHDVAAIAYLLDHGGAAATTAAALLAPTDPGGLAHRADRGAGHTPL